MNNLKSIVMHLIDYVIGWIESFKLQTSNYHYVIDTIQPNHHENNYSTSIRYKLVGCRTLLQDTVSELNNSHLFSLFRPDHAQIIVSIATMETLIYKNSNDIKECYQNYLRQCASQFQRETS